ncbi:hypothetical protein RRG08_058452 [Elysia crispata]|uniref:FERM domain-containing protein n=1 Tax=Elysia crispata TaxID=231223 RepID=A0AAE1CTT8_9GAST|nr:hypothetical protein RRG08_058452 [Elysia crispata]
MDVVVAMLKPKPGHATQGYKPQLYEILLMDSKTPPGETKPAKYLPMLPTLKSLDSEPRELVLTHVHKLTGIKGERALNVKWRKDGPQRASLSQTSLFFVPISPNDKISAEQAQQGAGFFPLEYVIDAVNSGSVFFPSATQTFLAHLQSWLWEKHQRPAMVECLFWQRAEFRVHYTVNNPCFIPNTRNAEVTIGGGGSIGGGGQAVKMNHFPQEVVKTANEALAKMLSIEKCDTVVMNPLFGSGLPYKPKVNTFVINQHWPNIPNYDKISIPHNILPGPRWQDRYPLHSFAAKGDQAEVDIRLKQNYDHSLVDSVGCAPIHYAARYGCISVVATLLSAGCSPNIQDGELSTPLHVAARKGNVQVARCLLQRPDIDLEVRDKDGKRPIDVCLSVTNKTSNHREMERLISEASKRPSNTVTVFLMDKTSKSVHLTAGNKTTVLQINKQLMTTLNIPPSYADIFTLWIGSKSLDLQLKLEHEVVHRLQEWKTRSVNMLTDRRDPPEEDPVLTWRRNVYISVDREKQLEDAKALDLLFHEAHHNFVQGLYPCKDEDIVTFATILFALQHQGRSNAKVALSSLNHRQLKELLPEVFLKENTNWVKLISKEYTSFRDYTPQRLKARFLSSCQGLTVYGSAFFTGSILSHHKKSSSSHANCYMGVNDVGIHIIDMRSKQMIQSLEYREIRYKHIREKTLLEIKVLRDQRESRNQRGSSTRGIIEIRTPQAGVIIHLMQQLDHIIGDYVTR